jgi:hypothetical protein
MWWLKGAKSAMCTGIWTKTKKTTTTETKEKQQTIPISTKSGSKRNHKPQEQRQEG